MHLNMKHFKESSDLVVSAKPGFIFTAESYFQMPVQHLALQLPIAMVAIKYKMLISCWISVKLTCLCEGSRVISIQGLLCTQIHTVTAYYCILPQLSFLMQL